MRKKESKGISIFLFLEKGTIRVSQKKKEKKATGLPPPFCAAITTKKGTALTPFEKIGRRLSPTPLFYFSSGEEEKREIDQKGKKGGRHAVSTLASHPVKRKRGEGCREKRRSKPWRQLLLAQTT